MIKFSFMIRTYVPYNLRNDPEQPIHNSPRVIRGKKPRRLFDSWFRLMMNKGRLIRGVVTLENGDKFIWDESRGWDNKYLVQ